ncbi:MAG: wax ester/triacylglycerol synthase family O-acyltransferase [Halioglobus sp.]|nr:wax ester/triacylglycerol synthase family O-acyltransferase [Halioglobus sp.]
MEQLTEMDANFLQQESARTPMHISPVIVYDQSHRPGGKVRYKDILTVFERNLHKSAIFRRKLAGGAWGLDAPYWVEDPDFDLEFHVRHLALPKPGDWRQFCILLSRLQARGLDMKRPLWEAYVIEGLSGVEGLPENSFAIMLKIHHAAIDGVSGAEIIAAIHSLSDEVEPPPAQDDWRGEREPGSWYVWSRAYLHNLKRPVKFFETVGHLVPAVIRANRESAARQRAPRKPLVEKTRFNGRVSSTRVTDALVMELDEVKAIRKALDGAVTINDIVVSIVGGAMRRYLQDKGELPADSLSCGAPISVRSERSSSSKGNQVSIMMIGMATDIEDPVERLRAVHDNAEVSKAVSGTLGNHVMMDLTEMFIPQVMGWGLQAATSAAARAHIPLPFHTIVSNVPGPQFPLYLAGARVSLMMGMGPLLHMMGLFHAVISGAGKISINFVSCREMLPDPEAYRQCLQQAYEDLRAGATALGGGKAARGRAARGKAARGKASARTRKKHGGKGGKAGVGETRAAR